MQFQQKLLQRQQFLVSISRASCDLILLAHPDSMTLAGVFDAQGNISLHSPVKMRTQFLNGYFEHSSRSKISVTVSNSIFYTSFMKNTLENKYHCLYIPLRIQLLVLNERPYSFPSSHVFFNMSLKTSKKIHLQEIYSVILVLSILKLFWITANPNISGHNASLLLPVCLAGGFEESAMPLLSATIRTHSIFCQILCFSIFFFSWTPLHSFLLIPTFLEVFCPKLDNCSNIQLKLYGILNRGQSLFHLFLFIPSDTALNFYKIPWKYWLLLSI